MPNPTEKYDEKELQKVGEQLEATKKEYEELWPQVNELINNIPEAKQVKLGEQLDKVFRGETTEEEVLQGYPEEQSPEKIILIANFKAITLLTAIEDLQEKYKPVKIKELTELAQDLADRIDYSAVLAYYDTFEDRSNEWDQGNLVTGLSALAYLRQANMQAKDGTLANEQYSRVEFLIDSLKTHAREWQNRGCLKEKSEHYHNSVSMEELKAYRLQMKEEIRLKLETLRNYAAIKNRFRDPNNSYKIRDNIYTDIATVLNLEDGLSNGDDAWKEYEYDPRFLEAISKLVAKNDQQCAEQGALPLTGSDLEKYIEDARAVNGEVALNNIKIEGLDVRADKILVVTEESLRDLLRKNIPPFFLNKIELLAAAERPANLDQATPKRKTTATEIPEFDEKGDLLKIRIEVYWDPYAPLNSLQNTKEFIRDAFEETTLHEIGHRIHYELTYEDMQDWEDVVKNDTTAVTWYVAHMRKESEILSIGEDFCESFMMAIKNPGKLIEKSIDRFEYMAKLITKYMPEEQRKEFIAEIHQKVQTYLDNFQKTIDDRKRIEKEILEEEARERAESEKEK